MKTLWSWIFESLVATAVIVLCLGIPSALELPLSTLALSVVPMLLYLSWRLDRDRFSWRFTLLMAVILVAGLFIQAYILPRSGSSVLLLITVISIATFASRLKRKRQERKHVG